MNSDQPEPRQLAAAVQQVLPSVRADLERLVRIPSVSADPAAAPNVQASADAVAALLDGGVKVHMVYGDRDFACNWMGGEAASLRVPYSHHSEFAAAGYAPTTR